MTDNWNNAILYDQYVGRWSRLTAFEFVKWLNLPGALNWVDVGCGTGALSYAILKLNEPNRLLCVDRSEDYIKAIKKYFADNLIISFMVSDAESMNIQDNYADVIVSGLVLNFIPDVKKALSAFRRILKPGGVLGAYVWDYSDKMEMMRYFWDSAVALFEDASIKDEGTRFHICDRTVLEELLDEAGFREIQSDYIEVPTVFKSFEDYWHPFSSAQGPAPGYYMSLDEKSKGLLKEKVHDILPIEEDGSIHLIARAIAVKARK